MVRYFVSRETLIYSAFKKFICGAEILLLPISQKNSVGI